MLNLATMMPSLRSRRLLTPLVCAVLGAAALAQSDLRARLLVLLPDNGQSADIMQWVADPEMLAVKERIRQANSLDPYWFRDYAARHPNTEYLPWHEKFGVSEQEYQRYLSADWLRLERSGHTARVLLTKSGNKVVFQGGTGAEALRGITLDMNTGELRVPEGMSAKPRAISVGVKEDRTGLGARKGWGWTIEGVNLKTRTAVIANLNLLQLANGAVLLAYNRGKLIDSVPQPDVDLTLMYQKKLSISKP